MKIVILGTAYPLRGGIAHYNALLYRELSKRHSVTIITFKRQYPSLFFPGKTQEEAGSEHPQAGTPVGWQVPSEPLVDSINPLNWIAVGKEIRRRKPDLLIMKYWLPFFGPCFGTIARIAKRGTNIKVLYICDNVVPHEHRPGDAALTMYAFRAADFFIVQSDVVERDLKKLLPSARYKNVPHPIYTIFGTPVEKMQARQRLGLADERVLLFFGYVRPYKGLSVMLEAMKRFPPELNATLLVVGEFYDEKEKYLKQIEALGVQHRVSIVSDYVPNDTVGLYFSAADVVLLPYLSATQSGIAQIAYNFDKPVIATAVGGLAEVVRDGVTGFVVPPNDPDALARAVVRYFAEQRESDFAANVALEKRKYSWEAMVRAIEEFMQR